MTQIISKGGVVKCVTQIPYPAETIKQMKKAGYRIKEKEDGYNKNDRLHKG